MGYMKFIRKGTGRPFPQGQFSEEDLERGALPGVKPLVWLGYHTFVEVRATDQSDETYSLLNFPRCGEILNVTAGFDDDHRPSFLTVEETEETPQWGVSPYWFSADAEDRISQSTLEQSKNIVEDLEREYYVAQWSLVTPPCRKRFRRTTPALYELTGVYDLCHYRSEGNFHVALGSRRSTLVPPGLKPKS